MPKRGARTQATARMPMAGRATLTALACEFSQMWIAPLQMWYRGHTQLLNNFRCTSDTKSQAATSTMLLDPTV